MTYNRIQAKSRYLALFDINRYVHSTRNPPHMPANGVDRSWTSVATSNGDGATYQVYKGPIDKPDLDNRDYRLLELANGLKAVLIHDPTADKAAACVHVAVGHMQDPVSDPLLWCRLPSFIVCVQFEVPGLAHFCEHMIMKASLVFVPAKKKVVSRVY